MEDVLYKKGRLEILDYSIDGDTITICVYDVYLDITMCKDYIIDESGVIYFGDISAFGLHGFNEYNENYCHYIGGYYPDFEESIDGRTDIDNICIDFMLEEGIISYDSGKDEYKKVSDSIDDNGKKKIKDLKKGDFFTLKPIEYPKENQVWIKGDFERIGRKYSCINYTDMNYERFFSGDKEVFLDFEF